MQRVADGQLAASAAAVHTGVKDGQLTAVLTNTSAVTTEVVLLTLTPAGGTARRVARASLGPNEQLFVQGIPVGVGDVLKGQTTTAATVDYVVALTQTDIPFTVTSLDANGGNRAVAITPAALLPVACGSAKTLTAADHNRTVNLGTVGGSTLTLPAATGSGFRTRVVVTATTTGGAHKILAASVADFMNGIAYGFTGSTAKVFAAVPATDHSIQMPFAGTQPSGGFAGDWFEVTDVAANLWQVSGFYQAGTTPTTPFAAATT